jgi:hypothetical protein
MDSPIKVAAHLRHVADKIDRSARPDRRAVMREIRATLASLEFVASAGTTSGMHTVGIYGQPGCSFKHEDTDMTSMMEAPFREAGASHFSWTKGGCQMMVPQEALPAVLQALQAVQGGSHGDELQKFYDGFQHEYTLDPNGARVVG